MSGYDRWLYWLDSLDRGYAFIGALVLVIVLVALWSKRTDARRDNRHRAQTRK